MQESKFEEAVDNLTPYGGSSPFIFVSCHPNDLSETEQILRLMQFRGLRFWFDAGIAPGLERDEVIAERIEACTYFIAFVSESYLNDLDTTDELNYSRDLNKDQLLIYLSDAELPIGIRMRMTRMQSLNRSEYSSPDALFDALFRIEGMNRFYGIEDRSLADKAAPLFCKLEAYYPEHRVFALDNIDQRLREKLAILCAQTEFDSVDDLLKAYGFSRIPGEQAKLYRRDIRFLPGDEPEIIRNALQNALQTAEQYYPDRIIADKIPVLHKNLYERLLALHQWLGYPDLKSFLEAYGYKLLYTPTSGRAGHTAEEYQSVLDQMKSHYADEDRPSAVGELLRDFPQYKALLKTLQNNAYDIYGTSLKKHLISEGILQQKEQLDSIPITQAKAMEALAQRCGEEQLESVLAQLEGISIRVSKSGQIYVYRTDECEAEVVLPDAIDSIHPGAFDAQFDLRRIVISSGCREIGENAFRNCESLEEVILPEGLSRIESGTFEGCSGLREITIPASVKTIFPHAFLNCSSLETIHLLNPGTSIYEGAFEGCPFSPPGNHPDNVEFLYTVDRKNRATITGFDGSAEVLRIPDILDGHPVLGIDKGAFSGRDELRIVEMADTVSILGRSAFSDCSGLERLHLSESIAKLEPGTFSGCTSLLEVNIPDALTELKRNTFKDAQLEALHIGKSIRNFDPNAFFKGEFDLTTGSLIKGKSIRSIDVDPDNPWLSADGTCLFSADGKTLLCDLGDTTEYTVPDGTEEIADSAFFRNPHLISVSFPKTLKKIGTSAFAETGITGIEFPSGLELIGEKAFSFCRALQDVSFSEGLLEIGDQAFEGCPIQKISLPATLHRLGKNVFQILSLFQGTAVQEFSVSPANPVFHDDGLVLYRTEEDHKTLVNAFGYDFRLPADGSPRVPIRYAIEPGTTDIEENAFYRCNNLSAVLFPEELQRIGTRAFMDCNRLEKADLPSSAAIEPFAFQGTQIALS